MDPTPPGSWLLAMLAGLAPCPLCLRRPRGATGACRVCIGTLFAPGSQEGTLWLGPYRGALRRCVVALKYGRAHRLAELLGAALAHEVRRRGVQPDLVCPVPQSRSRRRRRGYNQAARIAAALARRLGVPCRSPLRRLPEHGSQVGRGRLQRRLSAERAFRCDEILPPLRILLVDDVLTTGATSAACRRALRAAGARSVLVVVAARVVPGRRGDSDREGESRPDPDPDQQPDHDLGIGVP